MAEYDFLTTWLLEAEREPVWEAIHAVERWPEWWRGVERVTKLRDGGDGGVGSVYRHLWRSRVPYPVEFEVEVEEVAHGSLIAGRASGKLAGAGVWRLYESPLGTAVTYEWRVRTTPLWMNAFAPLARPIFEWNHEVVMRWGGEGIARLLGARLLAAD